MYRKIFSCVDWFWQLFEKNGEETGKDLQKAENAEDARERQRIIDEYNAKQAKHKKEVDQKIDKQTAEGNKYLKKMNPPQAKVFVEVSSSVCFLHNTALLNYRFPP